MRNTFYDERGKYIIDENNLTKLKKNYNTKTTSKNHIGNSDAITEWKTNKELARHMFLHTDAYHEFLNDSSLILLGRTGTGKTAILLSAAEDARQKNEHGIPCHSVVSINCEKLIVVLANCQELTQMNQTLFSDTIKEVLTLFINTCVIKCIYNELDDYKKNDRQIADIKKYLVNTCLINTPLDENFIDSFLDICRTSNSKTDTYTPDNTIYSISSIIYALKQKGYKDAFQSFKNYMNDKERVLVLMDSLNEYDVNNKDIVLIVKGLIDTCFHYYNTPEDKIHLKIALPSEIYNKVLTRLPNKQAGNTVVIRWKYKEIVILLALRIYAFYQAEKVQTLDFCEEFNDYSDFYADINADAYKNSIKLLENILPHSCPTSLSFEFLTLPYCIRHTLKKPREIIYMFNNFIDIILEAKNKSQLIERPELIKDAIHSTQDYMISSALSMYYNSYSGVYAAVESLFYNNDFVFTGKSIKDRLKKAIQSAKIETHNTLTPIEHLNSNNTYDYLDEYTLSQLLLESGLVGQIEKKSIIESNKISGNNQNNICILTADFEFRISATEIQHVFKDDVQYALHPMCYENYGCNVDVSTLVYPRGIEDDGDVVIDTITAT